MGIPGPPGAGIGRRPGASYVVLPGAGFVAISNTQNLVATTVPGQLSAPPIRTRARQTFQLLNQVPGQNQRGCFYSTNAYTNALPGASEWPGAALFARLSVLAGDTGFGRFFFGLARATDFASAGLAANWETDVLPARVGIHGVIGGEWRLVTSNGVAAQSESTGVECRRSGLTEPTDETLDVLVGYRDATALPYATVRRLRDNAAGSAALAQPVANLLTSANAYAFGAAHWTGATGSLTSQVQWEFNEMLLSLEGG